LFNPDEEGSAMSQIDSHVLASWRIISFVGIIILPQILPIIVGLLTPGRKGTMLTKRTSDWNNVSGDEAWRVLLERVRNEGFTIAAGPNPGFITVSRPKTYGGGRAATHASKPLNATFQVQPHVAGVTIEGTMTTPDLVILDTGEGKHIDQVLDRILTQHPGEKQEPPVPNTSYHAKVGVYCAAIMWVGVVAIVLLDASRAAGIIAGGLMLGLLIGVVLGAFGLIHTVKRPQEIRGKGMAIASIVLSVGAFAAGIGEFAYVHGDALQGESLAKFLLEIAPTRLRLF
jgi:hypothetical protein